MKRKLLWTLLAIEAAACVLLRTLQVPFAPVFTSAMAFPFEQLGLALRALSLSGGLGNAVAFALYIAISLIPAAVVLLRAVRRRAAAEDGLLALLSGLLFGVLYLLINPGIIGSLLGKAAALPVGKALLGGTVYSVLLGYVVLRVLRLFFAGSTQSLQRYLAALLFCMNLLFVWLAFGVGFGGMLDAMAALRAGNTGDGQPLGMSYFFLAVQCLVDALPYLLDVLVVFAALRLLDELRMNRYSARSVAAAERLARLCGRALAAVMLTNTAFNLAQLLAARTLLAINSTVQVPVLSVAFVLAVLLLARFFAENKQLKDDNELFI